MPLYEYKCTACGHTFETLVSVAGSKTPTACPACGSEKCEKQFSIFASSAGKTASAGPTSSCGGCSSRFT